MMRGTGNRCGYDPAAPRLDLRQKTPKHKFWNRAQKKVRPYHNQPSILPELAEVRGEGREGIGLVLQAMLGRSDSLTMRIGFPRKSGDGWRGAERARHLCKDTGLSVTRIDEAIEKLQVVGYVVRDGQPREQKLDAAGRPTGKWRGHGARRRVTKKLLNRLGLAVAYDLMAKKAYSEGRYERMRQRSEQLGQQGRRRKRAKNVPAWLAPALALSPEEEGPNDWPEETTPTARPRPEAPPPTRFDRIRRELEEEHPEWDADRVWREALGRLERG
jgi:hypothetical protein